MRENESFKERKKRKALGSRGLAAQGQVHKMLTLIKHQNQHFDFDRLPDARTAGRVTAAQVSDFLVFTAGVPAIALEVKQKAKGTRLRRSEFPQLARMARRENAGCFGWVLVHFKEVSEWALTPIRFFWDLRDAPSWDLSTMVGTIWHDNLREALHDMVTSTAAASGDKNGVLNFE